MLAHCHGAHVFGGMRFVPRFMCAACTSMYDIALIQVYVIVWKPVLIRPVYMPHGLIWECFCGCELRYDVPACTWVYVCVCVCLWVCVCVCVCVCVPRNLNLSVILWLWLVCVYPHMLGLYTYGGNVDGWIWIILPQDGEYVRDLPKYFSKHRVWSFSGVLICMLM
jgi:hypothetical protein